MNSKATTTTNKAGFGLCGNRKNRSPVIVLVLFAALSCGPIRSFADKCPTPTTTPAMVEIATYEEVKDLPNHPEKVLIDVREPNELQETGKIPTSINIPRKTIRHSFISWTRL